MDAQTQTQSQGEFYTPETGIVSGATEIPQTPAEIDPDNPFANIQRPDFGSIESISTDAALAKTQAMNPDVTPDFPNPVEQSTDDQLAEEITKEESVATLSPDPKTSMDSEYVVPVEVPKPAEPVIEQDNNSFQQEIEDQKATASVDQTGLKDSFPMAKKFREEYRMDEPIIEDGEETIESTEEIFESFSSEVEQLIKKAEELITTNEEANEEADRTIKANTKEFEAHRKQTLADIEAERKEVDAENRRIAREKAERERQNEMAKGYIARNQLSDHKVELAS